MFSNRRSFIYMIETSYIDLPKVKVKPFQNNPEVRKLLNK